uniref:Uncharacterized protein n=1 Tax=Marseillevirus LCMAC101 TaxID=2506602 RepID=A0A481YUH5_9VIRU|nr:MAG: uncharacterized protein LCMAC101_07510 [Marseillevirus LCMAC101]
MDNLDNLPLKEDTHPNSHEEEVMNKFFTQTDQNSHSPPRRSRGSSREPPEGALKPDVLGDSEQEGINWKIVGYTTVLFFALANPWIDMLFCKIPYCGDNNLMLLGIKTLIFSILYLIITIFFG